MRRHGERIEALAAYLEVGAEEIDMDRDHYTHNGLRYLVLTSSEADEVAKDYITGAAWTLNAEFLAEQTGLKEIVFEKLSELGDRANDVVVLLIDGTCGMRDFVSEAIDNEGRGSYIGETDWEINQGEFYLYPKE